MAKADVQIKTEEATKTVAPRETKPLAAALEELKKAEPRKFLQSVDLVVALRDFDAKKQENRFTEEIVLPSGRSKPAVVGAIGSGLVIKAKGIADELIDEAQLAKIETDKKALKRAVDKCDFFIAEAPLMLRIGKTLGKVLGPRGKMPKPVAPGADPKDIIERLKRTVRIKVTDSPVLQCTVGNEKMPSDDIQKNVEAVLAALEKRLPKGRANIRAAFVKTTMGAPIKIKV